MTMITDLLEDTIEEILSRIPITSRRMVGSTCKGWNALFNDKSFAKKHCAQAAAKELMAIMLYDSRACLTSIDLHNHKGLVNPSPKRIGEVKISKVFHCDGLLLCVTRNNSRRLVLWNPYLGQVRWIKPTNKLGKLYRYAIGYDNNQNQKISRIFYKYVRKNHVVHKTLKCEIYDLMSNSWKILEDTPSFFIRYHQDGVSVKGNTYFVALDRLELDMEEYIICLDFTRDKFGPRLNFPVHSCINDVLVLTNVRKEQLAVLFQREATEEIEIWITTKIEPDAVSWRSFLKVDMKQPIGGFWFKNRTFFVEEKKKAVVSWGVDLNDRSRYKAYVIGEDGYYKEMDLGKSGSMPKGCSYVPSSVQIQGLRPIRVHAEKKR